MVCRKLTVLFAALCLTASLAAGQPVAGDSEVQMAGSWFKHVGSQGSLSVDASYGYFLTPAFELGLRQSWQLEQRQNDRDIWSAVTAPFFDVHLINHTLGSIGANPIVPYLGGFLGMVWNDEDTTGTIGPEAGLKLYLSEWSFMNVRYRYEWFFESLREAENGSEGNHVVTFGIGYSWGGAKRHPN